MTESNVVQFPPEHERRIVFVPDPESVRQDLAKLEFWGRGIRNAFRRTGFTIWEVSVTRAYIRWLRNALDDLEEPMLAVNIKGLGLTESELKRRGLEDPLAEPQEVVRAPRRTEKGG
jgi:hypothetical protein